MTPSRDDAWALLCEWTEGQNLRRHGLAVEAAVAWYGDRVFGITGDELETWRMAGLLHDFDYERYPATHPVRGAEELRQRGYPDDVVDAVLGHGDHTGVPRTAQLARTVYACDEMSGFVTAVALVRPNRSLDEVDVAAVRKKMKDKGFARQVPRDQLTKGAEEIGVPFDEHVSNVVEGLKVVRAEPRAVSTRMIAMERTVDAPPDRVYRMWSDADTMNQWLSFQVEGSLLPGARSVLVFARQRVEVDVLEAEPNSRIRYRWLHGAPANLVTEVTVTIAPRGWGSRVTLTDGPYEIEATESLDAYAEAIEIWAAALTQLRASVDYSIDLRMERRPS